MKPNDMILLAVGLAVAFVIWKHMQTPPPAAPPVVASNPPATAGNLATGVLNLGASVANAAIGDVKSVVRHLNPLKWGGDSAATVRRKELDTVYANRAAADKQFGLDVAAGKTVTVHHTRVINGNRMSLSDDETYYWSDLAADGKRYPNTWGDKNSHVIYPK